MQSEQTGAAPFSQKRHLANSLQRVPWGVRDIVAATILGLATIVAVLAIVQAAESARTGKDGVTVASGMIGVVLALIGVAVVARVSHLRVVPALAVTLVAMAAGVAVTTAGGGTLENNDGEIAGVPVTVVLFSIIEGIFFSSAWLYGHIKHGVSMSSLGFIRTTGIRPYVSAAGYWLLAAAVVGVWVLAVRALGFDGLLPPDSAEDALDMAGGSIVLAIVLVGILGPIAEEAFFRGFLFNGLRGRFGVIAAILISSAVFGMFHVAPGAMVLTFFLGVAFAWIYLRTGSLWPAIFAHSLQNTLAILAAFFN